MKGTAWDQGHRGVKDTDTVVSGPHSQHCFYDIDPGTFSRSVTSKQLWAGRDKEETSKTVIEQKIF